MDKNTHVYCVDCKHFRMDDEYKPYCPYEPECDIWNCEDSKPFSERPYYKKIKTCWDCGQRISEECGIDGREVYSDSEACSSFEEYE